MPYHESDYVLNYNDERDRLGLHIPYQESDPLLNTTYNFLCGGMALEHIEYRRQDPAYQRTGSIPVLWRFMVV